MIDLFKKILLSFILMLITIWGFSQKGVEDGSKYGHGEDSITCIKNLSLYREFVKHTNYIDAIGPWKVVFNECPLATKNIYIDGAKMINYFIQNEKDPEKKATLIDTLMLIYDQRIKYFKQRGLVLGRKGVDYLRYKRDDINSIEEAFQYLEESVDILKNKSSIAVVATYMTATYTLYDNGRLTSQQVIENYAKATDIVDYQLKEKPNDDDVLKVKKNIDLNFVASGAPTCESLIAYLSPQYDSKKNDVIFLKRAVALLGTLDCEGDPLFAKTAESLYDQEPSAESAFNLAKLFVTKENFTKAVSYYKEAIRLEETPDKKADYYYQLGVVTNSKLNDPELARQYAYEVIKLRPNWGEPFILIGDAYIASKECFVDDFEKRTLYWVAVDKFVKAKSLDNSVSEKANERISTYSQYFPDNETIFFYSLKEGDNYTVGCWINETTTVRAR